MKLFSSRNILFIFILLNVWICKPAQEIIDKKNPGEIDFTENIELEASVLDRGWEYYPSQLITTIHDSQQELKKIKEYKSIPHIWSNGENFGTYRLRILLPDIEAHYALFIPEQSTAFKLYLNNKLESQSGIVSSNEDESRPSANKGFISFLAKDEIEIVIQISNFHNASGGFLFPIEFGRTTIVQDKAVLRFAIESLFLGSLFIIGLYHIILFLYRKSQKDALYFGLFSVVMALRILFIGNRNILFIFPDFSWDWIVRFEYCTPMIAIVLFIRFLNGLYKFTIPMILIRLSEFFILVYVAFVAIAPPIIFTSTSIIVQLSVLFFSLGILIFSSKILYEKKEDSWLFVTGVVLVIIGAVADALNAYFLVSNFYISHISLFIFFGVQTTLLELRMNRTHRKSETLSKQILRSNELMDEINSAYKKFVPQQFFMYLGKKDVEEIFLGDNDEKEFSIQFTQIQDFWQIVRGIPPENIFKFVNSYLSRMSPSIRSNGGIIDKFIDNTIMALYPDDPIQAIKASIDMQWEIEVYNIHRKKTGYVPISCKSGIHYGKTRLGIIGVEEKREPTVISDTVNLASRIQGLADRYGARILISLPTLYICSDVTKINYRMLDMVRVKGKKDPIAIGEIMIPKIDRSTDLKIESKDNFEDAILCYMKSEFAEAIEKFQQVLELNPNDIAAEIYSKRAKYFFDTGAKDDFEGIHQWDVK
ncbi:7TM diverse intracellular signaling domain-containing protein [Leptospira sp. GIMC2001]|uniref:7TM diverse intracellular signaling domain-containing protein n=1 Tax=Leptospira sp. GIMC2001 TaxID=1513297 RepID=UPI00234A0751|nr:7TM diverse intracellular signaling domain-containing protein [Leptospira sp. GIMC2001]WCL49839.1 hypothetical protein O4O04_03195 [Leptospira sp. GIMC2001]